MSTSEAKEQGMIFQVRMTYKDETFAIATYPADNYGHAIALAKADPAVRSVLVLCTIDPEPQQALAFSGGTR